MRIVVLSDTHGKTSVIERIIEEQKTADAFFFLGDGAREMAKVAALHPDKNFYTVNGNCDRAFDNFTGAVTLGGKRIMYTHGHLYGVKHGTEKMFETAKNAGVDIALYGHTHISKIEYRNGIYLLCPGSAGDGRNGDSYMAVDIVGGGIMPIIIPLNPHR